MKCMIFSKLFFDHLNNVVSYNILCVLLTREWSAHEKTKNVICFMFVDIVINAVYVINRCGYDKGNLLSDYGCNTC